MPKKPPTMVFIARAALRFTRRELFWLAAWSGAAVACVLALGLLPRAVLEWRIW